MRGPGDTCTHTGLHYESGTLSWGNPNILEAVSMPVLCFRGRHFSLLYMERGYACLCHRGRHFLYLQASLKRQLITKGSQGLACKTCWNMTNAWESSRSNQHMLLLPKKKGFFLSEKQTREQQIWISGFDLSWISLQHFYGSIICIP